MRLNIHDEIFLEDPTSAELMDALSSLSRDDFAILEQGEQHYIQTCISDDVWFVEYRAGGPEHHFELESPASSIEQVHRIFDAYLRGEPFEQMASWIVWTS